MADIATGRCRVCGHLFTYRVLGKARTRCFSESCRTKKLARLVSKPPQVVVRVRSLDRIKETGFTHEERIIIRERVGKAKREQYWRERRLSD